MEKELIRKILREGLNLPKKQIRTEIQIDEYDKVYYITNKYGNAIEIEGDLYHYNSGRADEIKFEYGGGTDEYSEEVYDQHYEDINKEIEDYYWDQQHIKKNIMENLKKEIIKQVLSKIETLHHRRR